MIDLDAWLDSNGSAQDEEEEAANYSRPTGPSCYPLDATTTKQKSTLFDTRMKSTPYTVFRENAENIPPVESPSKDLTEPATILPPLLERGSSFPPFPYPSPSPCFLASPPTACYPNPGSNATISIGTIHDPGPALHPLPSDQFYPPLWEASTGVAYPDCLNWRKRYNHPPTPPDTTSDTWSRTPVPLPSFQRMVAPSPQVSAKTAIPPSSPIIRAALRAPPCVVVPPPPPQKPFQRRSPTSRTHCGLPPVRPHPPGNTFPPATSLSSNLGHPRWRRLLPRPVNYPSKAPQSIQQCPPLPFTEPHTPLFQDIQPQAVAPPARQNPTRQARRKSPIPKATSHHDERNPYARPQERRGKTFFTEADLELKVTDKRAWRRLYRNVWQNIQRARDRERARKEQEERRMVEAKDAQEEGPLLLK